MSDITGGITWRESPILDEEARQKEKESGSEMTRELDERKEVKALGIKEMYIDSAIADIKIGTSNSSVIEARLHGRLDKGENVNFRMEVADSTLKVILGFTGSCYYSELNLDIRVPHKAFKETIIKSLLANITLDEEILTEKLIVRTKHGNVESNARFKETSIVTTNGDVELYTSAPGNICISISTVKGNILAELENVGIINFSSEPGGDIRNHHKAGVGHEAKVDISTKSGTAVIR